MVISHVVVINHIVLYLIPLHSCPQVNAALLFHFVTGWFTYYKWINKESASTRTNLKAKGVNKH